MDFKSFALLSEIPFTALTDNKQIPETAVVDS